MLCVDVNVLVYAHRADLREHADYRGLLERLANDDEPLGLPDSVLAGFIRVVTNRRVFKKKKKSNQNPLLLHTHQTFSYFSYNFLHILPTKRHHLFHRIYKFIHLTSLHQHSIT
ncbi:hypothetical protein NLK95_28025, partial [Klebsiella pneumoniae]|nr:hypothetical protein [Klebsiella pneumoniae]